MACITQASLHARKQAPKTTATAMVCESQAHSQSNKMSNTSSSLLNTCSRMTSAFRRGVLRKPMLRYLRQLSGGRYGRSKALRRIAALSMVYTGTRACHPSAAASKGKQQASRSCAATALACSLTCPRFPSSLRNTCCKTGDPFAAALIAFAILDCHAPPWSPFSAPTDGQGHPDTRAPSFLHRTTGVSSTRLCHRPQYRFMTRMLHVVH